jgi:hypothetical protein
VSLLSFPGSGAKGMGAEPSPTMTIIPVVVFVVALLAAEIAPASIKLARAAMSVFFTVTSPSANLVERRTNNMLVGYFEKIVQFARKQKTGGDTIKVLLNS